MGFCEGEQTFPEFPADFRGTSSLLKPAPVVELERKSIFRCVFTIV